MARRTQDSINCDLIQRCDSFLKNNIDKFYDYAKYHETFRLQLIASKSKYKNLQAWLDSAYVSIISLKSERGELLLENSSVVEFLHIMNDLNTERLKFVKTINECKLLKRTVSVVNKEVVSLKSEYNDLKQSRGKMAKKGPANKTLHNEHERKLIPKMNGLVNSCDRLNSSLDIAFEHIKALNEKHDNLMDRYRVLTENETVKEFLDYAKHQTAEVCSNENECQPVANEEISSLKLQLINTLQTLNFERLQHQKVENERNSLDKLSARLRSSLFKRQDLESTDEINQNTVLIDETQQKPAKTAEHLDATIDSTSSSAPRTRSSRLKNNSSKTSHRSNLDEHEISCCNEDIHEPAIVKIEKNENLDDSEAASSSNHLNHENQLSCLNENDEELVVIKEESAKAFPIIFADSIVSSPSCSYSNLENNNGSKNKCDTLTLSSEANDKNTYPTCCRQLRKRKKKRGPRVGASQPPKKVHRVDRVVENESFNCDSCRKSFIVKPNERKPQNCPFCVIVPSYSRSLNNKAKASVATVDKSAISRQSVSSAVIANLLKQYNKVLS